MALLGLLRRDEMTNEPPTFEEFIDTLYSAGWRATCDAQHENILPVYNEWRQRLHNADSAAEYWRLLAERSNA